jgi:four helix bundle protein
MARFIRIAMGSGAELSYHLLLSRDLDLIEGAEFERLTSELEEVMKMLSALSGKLKNPMQPSVSELRAKG